MLENEKDNGVSVEEFETKEHYDGLVGGIGIFSKDEIEGLKPGTKVIELNKDTITFTNPLTFVETIKVNEIDSILLRLQNQMVPSFPMMENLFFLRVVIKANGLTYEIKFNNRSNADVVTQYFFDLGVNLEDPLDLKEKMIAHKDFLARNRYLTSKIKEMKKHDAFIPSKGIAVRQTF